jgi:hypothetical protein
LKIKWIFNNEQRVFSENISVTLETVEVRKASIG